MKFGRDDMVKRFTASHFSGFYLRVLREGDIGAGDEIIPVHRDENRVTVLDALRLRLGETDSEELRNRALQIEYLSPSWREEFCGQS
jgi:MOSC domain-containing protein YiiM